MKIFGYEIMVAIYNNVELLNFCRSFFTLFVSISLLSINHEIIVDELKSPLVESYAFSFYFALNDFISLLYIVGIVFWSTGYEFFDGRSETMIS